MNINNIKLDDFNIKFDDFKGVKEHHYGCPICKDTGWINTEDEEGRIIGRRCQCFYVKRAKELMELSGISERELADRSFEKFDTEGLPPVMEFAKIRAMKYAEDFDDIKDEKANSIMFLGRPGTGKTHLGIAICGELLKKNHPVIYMAYRDAAPRIKQLVNEREDYDRMISRYKNATVLYIDDFLKGSTTKADINFVYEIINYRYTQRKPIILSSEMKTDDLITWDEALGSRLIEMCGNNVIEIPDNVPNRRLKPPEET